ncbi:MAG: DsrE/DsrF/DrsH-like family protein [Proteobacteria bacterium]|nr:DsrE/DsrF/DrsH-like family protein [Pseudomonadota bacterium]
MSEKLERAAFICSRDTIDGAYPALVLGINAARDGMETKVFYTFMGINLLKQGGMERAKFIPAGLMGSIPGMSSMATHMMKRMIDRANIPSLAELQEMAQLEGIELIACRMTVDMMDLEAEELIEGAVIWNAADFLRYAKEAKICLFT